MTGQTKTQASQSKAGPTGWLLIAVTIALAAILSSACVKRPAALANRALASFNHQGFDSCTVCHEKDRPKTAVPPTHGLGGDCAQCHVPGTSWKQLSSNYTHNPLPTTCAQCHETRRPAPVNGLIHGNGQDCVACHLPPLWSNPNAGYSHSPLPTTCGNCHETKRPVPVAGRPHGKGLDCYECHSKSAGVTWAFDLVGYHQPLPTNCGACHDRYVDRPLNWYHALDYPPKTNAQAGHFGGSDCARCHQPPVAQTVTTFSFAHTNSAGASYTTIASNAGGTCLPCHETERPSPAQDPNHPTSGDCILCHQASAPVNGVSQPWARSAANAGAIDHSKFGSTTLCVGCHDTGQLFPDRPSVSYAPLDYATKVNALNDGHFSPGTPAGECASCHHIPDGVSVPAWKFNHKTFKSNAATGDTTIATCLPCHAAERPAPAQYPTHPTAPADCASCHQESAVNTATGWKASAYVSHTPLPAACNNCHQTGTGGAVARPAVWYLPLNAATKTSPQAGHYGTSECLGCHQSPNTGATAFTFSHSNANGVYFKNFTSGATCLPCHASERPTAAADPNHPTTGDCASCHLGGAPAPGAPGTWGTAGFSHSPLPTSCNSCHNTGGTTPLRPSQWYLPLNYAARTSPQAGHYGTADCYGCHQSPLTGAPNFMFSGAFAHTNAQGTNFINLTSGKTCLPCHSSERAISGYDLTGASVAHGGAGSDCALCHTGTTTSSWNTRLPNTHSPLPTTCSYCHEPSRPANAQVTNRNGTSTVTYTGHFKPSDCTKCHRTPAWTFNHYTGTGSTKITTCLPCHEQDRRSSTHYAGQDCANSGCHKSVSSW